MAFWFGTGCAGVALLLLVLFVRIDRAKSDLTCDEKGELETEVSRRSLILPTHGVSNRGDWSEVDITALPATRWTIHKAPGTFCSTTKVFSELIHRTGIKKHHGV